MRLINKIKAGSLQFVLFIGAVIAVLLITFVLLSYTHGHYAKRSSKYVEVIAQNNFVMQLALKKDNKNLESTSNTYEENGITTTVEKKLWGTFERLTASSSFEKLNFKSTALTGYAYNKIAPALYLKDNERPLVIAGIAKITGEALLPKQGVRPGNISGESYYGSSLVFGNTKLSNANLPDLKAKTNEHIKSLCQFSINPNSDYIIRPSKDTAYSNSFFKDTQYVVGDYVDLTSISLTGNIIVLARREIVVSASTKLTDVLLSAPKISIKDNVQGAFQAFASKSIIVGKNCSLNYPSALVVYENTIANRNQGNQPMVSPISINSNSVIRGILIYKNSSEERVFYPQIKIASNTTLIGQLYCEKSLELKGNIVGSVFTDSFMALENGNIYQNHLYKGTINSMQLQDQFVGLGIDNFSTNKKVVKWLY
jgi:cytoskeletal protein CcmA (bactofilin family)